MGAWGTDPFDNDHAADFAGDLGATPKEERQKFLHKALQAVEEDGGRDFEPEYEFPSEHESAIAACAFLADARKGEHVFTDTVYAMVLDDSKDFKDDDAWSHIELDAPEEWLVAMAVRVMDNLVKRMKRADIETEWIDPSERILESLRG